MLQAKAFGATCVAVWVVGALLVAALPAAAATPTQIINPVPTTSAPALYGLYEIGFDLSTEYAGKDRFDPSVVDVRAAFRLPNGAIERVPAFYKQNTSPRWAVRYAPRASGTYSVTLEVIDATGKSQSNGPSFTTSEPSGPGFLRTSGLRLRTSNGDAFVINGVNVAWATDTDPTFDQAFNSLVQKNMNFARVWASANWDKHAIEYAPVAWQLKQRIETYGGLGSYHLSNAARADAIFANAAERGIYVQWVLASFGDFLYSWKANAYNSANGGPCATETLATCFHTNAVAVAAWKNYLRYNFARWGAYSSFGMVEYMNELDQAIIYPKPQDVTQELPSVTWHRTMDTYWKQLDIYRRPSTTSFAWMDHFYPQRDLKMSWKQLSFLSVANQHRYFDPKRPQDSINIVDTWLSEIAHMQTVGGAKPAYFGEYGMAGEDSTSINDPNGYHFHDGAWVPFFFGQAAGTNLTWRVDNTFVPHGVTADGARAFGAFLKGEQRALANLPFRPSTTLTGNVRMAGYVGADRALLLVRDWDANWSVTTPASHAGIRVSVPLSPGTYSVQY